MVKKIFLLMIEFYRRYISPLKAPTCRFVPSCSAYAKEAVNRYGAFKGGLLSLMRLLKCHPFHHGGYDPIK
ncbi:MAG: membrane protein insertion efficiency factor YidD [Firmicutes bacterium]|nr:membrane protein insertion efficiency factor YidD [Bacillota bacterium]